MDIIIKLDCPTCGSQKIKKNGRKKNGKQNYYCLSCHRQFISDYMLEYKGCSSTLNHKIELMLVRGVGIRDIAVIEDISINKVLSVLCKSNKILTPKLSHYDSLEVDEFWTYIGNKGRKLWLIYAYHRSTGEVVAWVWGKRNYKTAQNLRLKLYKMGISFDIIYTDNWNSFKKVFVNDNHKIGKKNTVGIEGNNCRLRHRIRRSFRKTCCFSKKLLNHIKAFRLAFFYINEGYI